MRSAIDHLDGCTKSLIDGQRIRRAERLCFFAHYDQDGVVAPHVLRYLAALRQCGFTVVVLSTATLNSAEQDKITAAGDYLILRSNEGMDFGGWIEACMRFFPIEAKLLLLANDSVYGPLSDLGRVIERLTADEADFYGLVESREIIPHLQSWFLLFRPTAYRSESFAEIMRSPMVPTENKDDLVARYEVGLSRALVATGLRYRALFPPASPSSSIAACHPYNGAHLLWREMITAGVPFIKVELLRYNLVRVTNIAEWRDVVGKIAPEMVRLIDQDLDRRGVHHPPSFAKMSYGPQIYWPEFRKLVLDDYRKGAGRGRSARIRALRWRMAISRMLRRIYIAVDHRLR